MNSNRERIVVFVSAAQKRALATRAQSMGISVSELVRRAVLAFDETAGDVRAAQIIDSWRTPHAPDALDETLRRIARVAAAADASERIESTARVTPAAVEAECEPPGDSLSVAAAVARALAQTPPPDACDEPQAVLDAETVARVIAHGASASGADAAHPRGPRRRCKTADTVDTDDTPPV
ncbi:hypothetical protein LJR230_001714 [Trinickia sp. LjRoot230]|uniref:hypothetical protein n=1 Tax=Trinickia sp. LjRoot230 TaxID=3342288 RepID=UPI003ECFD629